VERNAKRAALIEKAEDWRWNSLWRRTQGNNKQKELLNDWPVPAGDYLKWINKSQPKEEIENIRFHLKRGRPYGEEGWTRNTAKMLGLDSTFRERGRPRGN
jgi:putative transposase